jgi:hypothetical protein
MRKLYEIFNLLRIQKRIVAAATIWGNTVCTNHFWKIAAVSLFFSHAVISNSLDTTYKTSLSIFMNCYCNFWLRGYFLTMFMILAHSAANCNSTYLCTQSRNKDSEAERGPRTTDTQWRHKSKISEKLGRCGRPNMLWPYLKIWNWD